MLRSILGNAAVSFGGGGLGLIYILRPLHREVQVEVRGTTIVIIAHELLGLELYKTRP